MHARIGHALCLVYFLLVLLPEENYPYLINQ